MSAKMTLCDWRMIFIVLKIGLFALFLSLIHARDLLLLAPCDPEAIAKDPQSYLWSEKLDGIRAYWNGKNLYTRGGKILNPPSFFIQNFPPFSIDGELWSKRGDFQSIASIVKSKAKAQQWRELKFYIFEVPHQSGGILDRLQVLRDYLSQYPAPFISIIPQNPLQASLSSILEKVSDLGGEGIVVRDKHIAYYTGRSKHAMKCKPYQDRECKITQYILGKGKFENKVGSFVCQDEDNLIKIGSGMDDSFRENPPPIGTIITYKFFGLTQKGKPRFPTFLRIYPSELHERKTTK